MEKAKKSTKQSRCRRRNHCGQAGREAERWVTSAVSTPGWKGG